MIGSVSLSSLVSVTVKLSNVSGSQGNPVIQVEID